MAHGSLPIVYKVDETSGVITLLTIYDKEKVDTISAEEIARLKELAKAHLGILPE